MIFEHWIYSLAIAIIAGMIHFKHTGRDYSWIIIATAYAPDLDILASYIFKRFDIGVFINGIPLRHGDFHNIPVLLIFAGVIGLLLKTTGMKFKEASIFAGIGFGAHIFEDAVAYIILPTFKAVFRGFNYHIFDDILVHNSGNAFLWPLSSKVFSIKTIEYKYDLYGIANTEIFIAGIIAVIFLFKIRMIYEENYRLKTAIKAYAIAIIFSLMISSLLQHSSFLKEEGIMEKFVDNWQFENYTSWDSTVFHNGNYSARIEIQGDESKISSIWRSSEISVKPDTNYTFSSWGKTERAGGNNSPAVRVVELDDKGKWIRQTIISFGKESNNWTQKQVIFKTRSNASLAYVYGNIWNGFGTFWFDDVELIEEGTDQNIISNSGFENGINRIINLRI